MSAWASPGGGRLNERDRFIGRMLLERGYATRETLHRAAALTTQRRQQTGRDVELLAVLVEMGALERARASEVWQAAARHAPAATSAPGPAPEAASVPLSSPAPGASQGAPAAEAFDPTGSFASAASPAAPPGFSSDAPTLLGTFPPPSAPAGASTPGSESFVRPAGAAPSAVPPTIDPDGPPVG
ncbi:MAG: hypothetical protein D6731_11010, partial [Planctomycetota bacterium]